MGLRKCWILLAVVLALGMSLTGCMRNVGGDDVAGATDAPTNMPNFMPQNTQTDASANAPFDWTKNAAQIEGQSFCRRDGSSVWRILDDGHCEPVMP